MKPPLKTIIFLALFGTFSAFLLMSCAPTRPAPGEPGAPPPLLDKTFGEISFGPEGEVRVSYKNIHLSVDPSGPGSDLFRRQLDYLLVTSAEAAGRLSGISTLRKDQKVVSPSAQESRVKQAGFRNVKGMEDGQKLLLQKDGGHAFLALSTLGTDGNGGYFLEFDSGRNVFIGGPSSHPDDFRPFLYRVRDEGKPIHLAVVNAGGFADKINFSSEVLALLQPSVGVVHGGIAKTDQEAIARLNEANLFFGRFEPAASEDRFEF